MNILGIARHRKRQAKYDCEFRRKKDHVSSLIVIVIANFNNSSISTHPTLSHRAVCSVIRTDIMIVDSPFRFAIRQTMRF
jgi:hypothetical protein